MSTVAAPVRPVIRDPRGRFGGSAPVVGLAGLTAVLLGLPVAVLVGRAVAGGAIGSAATTAVLDALRLSLATTAISLVVTVCLGTPLAFVLARRRFRGISIVETIVDLPIVLPPTVAGLGSLSVWVVVPVSLPRVWQSSMPVKRFWKPPGPWIVKS